MTAPIKLRALHALFLAELMKDPERLPGPAYTRAYGMQDEKLARVSAARLLGRADVAAERARLEAEYEATRPITADEVRREITTLAKADPRDLFEVYRGCCRYCHGAGHQYQRTPQEFRDAWADYMACPLRKRDDPHGLKFDHKGGIGFNAKARPHPNCPECFGDGQVYEVIKDSRDWTHGAARLFSSLQRTKDGLKLSTRSQDGALKLAAQLHNLLAPDPDANDPDKNLPPPSTVVYRAKDASKKGGV
jgi:hypothetical protein